MKTVWLRGIQCLLVAAALGAAFYLGYLVRGADIEVRTATITQVDLSTRMITVRERSDSVFVTDLRPAWLERTRDVLHRDSIPPCLRADFNNTTDQQFLANKEVELATIEIPASAEAPEQLAMVWIRCLT
ncbi:hypothetical protein GCM10009555_019270 [Acrocarpospora macrocephala]|uniref:Uncharacterized protein n=1 Tax=Acrocarpospora macrocephala TaxID=150177 RepID=A0A5M3WET7_9ACTN|nr:hypothetical protein [Acrocarpospora macrocephala]GES07587.1 hypothetical protein Amac_011820 [Acrocarpospora macrocephala]